METLQPNAEPRPQLPPPREYNPEAVAISYGRQALSAATLELLEREYSQAELGLSDEQ